MFDEDGTQYLCATMMDANNCTALHCAQVTLSGGQVEYCNNEFGYQFQRVETPVNADLVEIVYTDASGKSYFSSLVEQD